MRGGSGDSPQSRANQGIGKAARQAPGHRLVSKNAVRASTAKSGLGKAGLAQGGTSSSSYSATPKGNTDTTA